MCRGRVVEPADDRRRRAEASPLPGVRVLRQLDRAAPRPLPIRIARSWSRGRARRAPSSRRRTTRRPLPQAGWRPGRGDERDYRPGAPLHDGGPPARRDARFRAPRRHADGRTAPRAHSSAGRGTRTTHRSRVSRATDCGAPGGGRQAPWIVHLLPLDLKKAGWPVWPTGLHVGLMQRQKPRENPTSTETYRSVAGVTVPPMSNSRADDRNRTAGVMFHRSPTGNARPAPASHPRP